MWEVCAARDGECFESQNTRHEERSFLEGGQTAPRRREVFKPVLKWALTPITDSDSKVTFNKGAGGLWEVQGRIPNGVTGSISFTRKSVVTPL